MAPLGPSWRRELDAIRSTRSLVPLLMTDAAALQIQICVRAARSLDGAMAEAGVLMGGSARLICDAKGDADLHLFDVFETLQRSDEAPGSGMEAAVREHFGAVHGTRAQVERLLASYENVHFHPGLFPESAPKQLAGARYSFVHIDLDLEQCVGDALAYFQPRMVPGGIIIGDDYGDAGVRRAFATYFATCADTMIELPWGQVMIVKQG